MKDRYRNITNTINSGSEICRRIKKIFHPDEPWSPVLSDRISKQFTKCKRHCRKLGLFEDDDGLFVWMMSLPDEDYKDILESDVSMAT